MINVRKRRVGLQSEDCPLCLSATESTNHIFALCLTTKVVCALLAVWVDWWPKNVSLTQDIWSAICSAVGDKCRKQVRKVIVAAFFWTIWSQRNYKVFKGSIVKEKVILGEIQFLAFDWIRCRSKFGKLLIWEGWVCNPVEAAFSCNSLASR